MGLPPKSDPDRVVFLAARTLRVLGGLNVFFGFLYLAFAAYAWVSLGMFEAVVATIASVIMLGFGFAMFRSALGMTHFQVKWATVSIVIVAIELALTALNLTATFIEQQMPEFEGQSGPIHLIFGGLFVLAFIQLLVYCIQARKRIVARD